MSDAGCGFWLRLRCYACGHRLRFEASGCPQCGETFDGREDPAEFPEACECKRCADERPRKNWKGEAL